ncbi:sensor histidine kinase [Polyangium fumosum]|uniref:histidine kinase n=1 Tax=Polyangium fumosum TaxID=889272 RepID=A0A4U1JIC9_9BACT|nr:ATP-binding protein [Polyangium fumosum]TKD12411.1 ATP-binding protein [Polyangium fumosum]
MNALVDNLHQGTLLRRGLESSAAGVVDLCEIVQRLEARFAALGALRGVEVAASFPERPVITSGAPALAERAIANLVHNAVRHGRHGGHVAVILEREGDTFELTVADDGPGIGRDQLASLQEATFGGDEARPRSGGLGLTVTLEAARRLGWEVRFEAGEAPGLRVVVAGACRPAGLG